MINFKNWVLRGLFNQITHKKTFLWTKQQSPPQCPSTKKEKVEAKGLKTLVLFDRILFFFFRKFYKNENVLFFFFGWINNKFY